MHFIFCNGGVIGFEESRNGLWRPDVQPGCARVGVDGYGTDGASLSCRPAASRVARRCSTTRALQPPAPARRSPLDIAISPRSGRRATRRDMHGSVGARRYLAPLAGQRCLAAARATATCARVVHACSRPYACASMIRPLQPATRANTYGPRPLRASCRKPWLTHPACMWQIFSHQPIHLLINSSIYYLIRSKLSLYPKKQTLTTNLNTYISRFTASIGPFFRRMGIN